MYTHKWQQFQLNAGGQFNFDGSATGNGFADFLTGFASSYSEPASVDFVHITTTTTICMPWTTGGSATA